MVVDVAILLDIGLILVFAKLFGEIAERLGSDAMLGEILAGLLLGPVLFWVTPKPFIEELAFFGLLMILFLIGLDISYDDIKKESHAGGVMAVIADGFAFAGGFLVGYFVFNSFVTGVVLGVIIISTSTVIPLKIMGKMNMLKTRFGQVAISMAMADDIIAIVALSLLSKWIFDGTVAFGQAVMFALAILGFILVLLSFGSKVIGRVLHVFGRMKDEQMMLSIPLALSFFIAYLSNELGIAAITGAFVAGAAMSGSRYAKTHIEPKIKYIGHGFFIPMFFVYSALIVNLQLLSQFWWAVVLITSVAIFFKMFGAIIGAKYHNFKGKEIGVIALSTMPRGEYSVVLAQMALGLGVIGNQIYGAVIGLMIITLIITPISLRIYTRKAYFLGMSSQVHVKH